MLLDWGASVPVLLSMTTARLLCSLVLGLLVPFNSSVLNNTKADWTLFSGQRQPLCRQHCTDRLSALKLQGQVAKDRNNSSNVVSNQE